jgi:hypothetical protein
MNVEEAIIIIKDGLTFQKGENMVMRDSHILALKTIQQEIEKNKSKENNT